MTERREPTGVMITYGRCFNCGKNREIDYNATEPHRPAYLKQYGLYLFCFNCWDTFTLSGAMRDGFKVIRCGNCARAFPWVPGRQSERCFECAKKLPKEKAQCAVCRLVFPVGNGGADTVQEYEFSSWSSRLWLCGGCAARGFVKAGKLNPKIRTALCFVCTKEFVTLSNPPYSRERGICVPCGERLMMGPKGIFGEAKEQNRDDLEEPFEIAMRRQQIWYAQARSRVRDLSGPSPTPPKPKVPTLRKRRKIILD